MKIKCNKCQNEMIDKSKGPYISYVCPICGNAIATYDYEKDDLIKFDETKYEINIINDNASLNSLNIISKMSGLNYLQCKNIISKQGILFYGKANEIVEKLKILKNNNISFEVNPEFPYEI